MNTASIPLYCFDWHLSQSPAQNEVLINPLLPYLKFDVTAWDGLHLNLSKEKIKKSPLVFFLFPPPPNLLSDPDAQIIWIPMWDLAREYNNKWWKELPKSLRIVAFSNEVRLRAETNGLSTLTLKYYKNPDELQQASWSNGRKLFYWNRTGLVSLEFLENICKILEVDTLFFRRRIDPGWPKWCNYVVPKTFGRTIVKELALVGDEGYKEYLKHLSQANIFIAPRLLEGIGLSFIEAMARGYAVFSANMPTMSEYIVNKKNGYLFDLNQRAEFNSSQRKFFQRIYRLIYKLKLTNVEVLHPVPNHPVAFRQNWMEIKNLNLQVVGNNARLDHFDGYKIWKNSLPQLASFILDW